MMEFEFLLGRLTPKSCEGTHFLQENIKKSYSIVFCVRHGLKKRFLFVKNCWILQLLKIDSKKIQKKIESQMLITKNSS